MICPCCGSAITDPPTVDALATLRYGTQAHAMMQRLIAVYPRGMGYDQLIDAAWPPGSRIVDNPIGNVRSIIKDTRRKLAPYGWTISSARGGVGMYKLECVQPDKTGLRS